MQEVMARPFSVPWRSPLGRLAVAVLAGYIAYVVFSRPTFITPTPEYAVDWWTLHEASQRLGGGMYDWGAVSPQGDVYAYRYSPVLAWLIGPFDLPTWRALHVAVLAFLPWRIALVALLAFPFWADIHYGNMMAFVFVAAYLTISGSRWATGAFLVLTLLVPRPLMLPVVAWVLWKHPEWRLPFAGAVVALTILTLASGQGFEFAAALLRSAGDYNNALNFAPSRFIGAWWLLVALPLGAWLTWKGRLGLASLAVSPYWLPYFLLMPLLELSRSPGSTRSEAQPH